MQRYNKTVCRDFSLESQWILYRKPRDPVKEFTALLVLTSLLEYGLLWK